MIHHVAFFQLTGDVFHRDAQLDHQHHDMVSQVADFVDGLFHVALGARNDDFGALLADFFQDFFQALVKQIGGVAAFLGVGLAALDQVVQPLPGKLFELLRNCLLYTSPSPRD